MPGTVKLRKLGPRAPSFSVVLRPVRKAQLLRIRNRTVHFADADQESRLSSPVVRLRAENPSLPSPRVPTEIIDRIVELLLEECEDAGDVPTPPYITTTGLVFMEGKNPRSALILPLLLASSFLRKIALRQYFSVLVVHTPARFACACKTLCSEQAFHWVKSMHASSCVFGFYYHVLMFLSRLKTVSIDFFYDGLATQHFTIDLFVRHLAIGARNTLTSLTLVRLSRVDFSLCSLISRTFSHLVELRLSCTERLDPGCCWECLEESASTMVHSPIPDVCADIRVLASSYAVSLKPLTQLRRLHLGVFLSRENLFISHLRHGPGFLPIPIDKGAAVVHYDGTFNSLRIEDLEARSALQVQHTPPPQFDIVPACYRPGSPYLPTRCAICAQAFPSTARRELVAGVVIAEALVALEEIRFSSFFGTGDQDEFVRGWAENGVARVQVQRRPEGKVTVRRALARN